MTCPYCEGISRKYRGNQKERLPLVDSDIDCGYLGTSQLKLYIDEGFVEVMLSHNVTREPYRKIVAVNCCPICKREMIPATIQEIEDKDEYAFLEHIDREGV